MVNKDVYNRPYIWQQNSKQALGRRPAPQYARPLSSMGIEAPRATELTAPADGNVAVGSHAQVPTLTAEAAWRVNAAASKAAWWPWLWPFDIESGVRVTYDVDVGYLCTKFSLPRPLSLFST